MNKVILMGRPTANPDIRYSQKEDGTQTAIARFTLAVDRLGEGSDFISCVAFGKSGEFAEKHVSKGRKYAIEGRIQTGSYTNKEGKKVCTTEVICERFEFCDSKNQQEEQTPPSQPDFVDVPEGIEESLPFK